MRTLRRIARWFLALLLVGLVGGYWYERPLLLTATGYAAHNDCALRAISDRTDSATDLPANPLVPVLRTKKLSDNATAGSILGVLAKQRAWLTPGFGCSVGDEAPLLPKAADVTSAGNPFAEVATPTMTPAVEEAVARAFGEGLSDGDRVILGTRAIVVIKDGKLIAERYAEGFDKDTPQLGWSMTKSLTNLMMGILVKQGRVSLDEDHLRPEWTDKRAEITYGDLLNMTSGLAWDETYDLGTPITNMLYLEPDMGDYVASQEAAFDPGQHQQYSSGSLVLLCDTLMDRLDADANLPRETLFRALGMSSAVLETDASGTPVCGSYAWATPRDWAAVGQFVLQNGQWGGEQLLPPGWLAQSTAKTAGETEEDQQYGYGWWLNAKPDGSAYYPALPDDTYFAEGHDGQWVVVVPSANLVVVRLGFSPEADDALVVQLTADLLAQG